MLPLKAHERVAPCTALSSLRCHSVHRIARPDCRRPSMGRMRSTNRRFSITGMVFAGIYILTSAACIVMALSVDDPKGRFVFLQIPIVLQTAVVPQGTLHMLEGISWPAAYAMFGLPTLLGLYLLGAALGKVASGR